MKAAERGAALTQRMLSFARKQELRLEAVDVAELVRGMADLLQRTIGLGVDIRTHFPLRLARANADPNQLELVVLNLAVNARDAMPDGGQIVIGADEREIAAGEIGDLPAGRYVRLTVSDRGTGMDAATLSRAMEPFFTTKGVGKGTGLGLSMAHGMAEQSGGRLILDSELGVGTTVELWLPAAAAVPAADAAVEPPPERGAANGEALTVLAVDDDPLVLTNTAAMLEDLGHRPLEASSPRVALEILERESVDLVITDYAMPDMNGAQLIEVIKATRPQLPVILATGFAELAADVELAADKLGKPFSSGELARAVATVMRRQGRNGEVVQFPGRHAKP
jgi:CheY-like chemotaxis protein